MKPLEMIAVALVSALTLLSTPASGQAPQGDIEGRIVDAVTMQPVPGTLVGVVGHPRHVAANDAGVYRIEDLGEGVYRLEVRSMGYADLLATDVVVVRGRTTYVNEISLTPVPVQLEGLTSAPMVADVGGSRHSFNREEIRRTPGAGDVVRAMGTLPGVSIAGGDLSAMTVRGGGVSDNLILIDNIPLEKITHFEGGSDEQEAQGGRFSIFTAGLIERVTFYGGGVIEGRLGYPPLLEMAERLDAPWLGLYGEDDKGIPPSDVEALRKAVAATAVPTEVVLYPGAGHAFNRDGSAAYHAPSATDAWARTLAWFDRYLTAWPT